jgi:hypothetical protein
MPMLVIVGQDAPGVFELLGRLNLVSVVIAKNPLSVGFMQS